MIYRSLIKKIVCMLFLFFSTLLPAQEIFMASNGNDNNPGTQTQPVATLAGARDKARSTGAKNIWIRGGRYRVTSTTVFNGRDSGLTISGFGNEKVIFDGGQYINPTGFAPVSGQNLNKLHNSARGQVFVQKINNTNLRSLLSGKESQISMDDRPMNIARYPNIGYALIDFPSVSGDQPRATGTPSAPRGPSFKFQGFFSFDGSKWSAELNRTKRAFTRAYISADWLRETNSIASVSSGGNIRLVNGTRYGIGTNGGTQRRGAVNRVYVMQLLCELDQPGEWYFDTTDNNLYIWPFSAINGNTKIGAWAGPEVIKVSGANNFHIERMTIQHLGKGPNGTGGISMDNCTSSEIAGVVFRNIGGQLTPANIRNGKNSGFKSCDFVDNTRGIRLYGGHIKTNDVVLARNYVENCHFTQVHSKDFYGNAAGLSGAGNIFRNNLVHNSNGQPITHGGQEHIIELNEIFNVGVEEGDGGSIYTGGNLWSFGTEIRRNFIHHLMSVPGIFGRQGVYCDDNDGGDIITQNFFYKGGMHSILTNSGPGHTISQNIITEANIAIRSNSGGGKPVYDRNMQFLNTNPMSTAKENYIGRMLQVTGVSGWRNGLNENNWIDRIDEFWTDRYPGFKFAMNKQFRNKENRPYECRWYNNVLGTRRIDFQNTPQVSIRGTKNISNSDFVNVNSLNLALKNYGAVGLPNIPFNNIGLYKDNYRCAVPDKNAYRSAVRAHFAPYKVHTNDPYDPRTINNRLYFNTGKLVFSAIPCSDIDNGDTSPPSNNCNWAIKPGKATDIGAGSNKVFVVGTDRSIHRYNNGSWVNMRSVNAKRVDVAYGSPYVLITNNDIYRNINNSGWQKIPGQGLDIGGSTNGLCVIGTNSKIYKYNGGGNWSQVKGIKGKRIDVTPQGTPWIIGMDDHIYQHVGGQQWSKRGDLKASDITISSSGTIWGIQLETGIPFKYKGNGAWEKFRGVLTSIAAQDNGNLWGTNVNNNIYENTCPDNKAPETPNDNTYVDLQARIKIHPNPTLNTLFVEIPESEKLQISTQIIDMNGKVVKTASPKLFNQEIAIDVSEIPGGMYILRVRSKEKLLATKPFVVK